MRRPGSQFRWLGSADKPCHAQALHPTRGPLNEGPDCFRGCLISGWCCKPSCAPRRVWKGAGGAWIPSIRCKPSQPGRDERSRHVATRAEQLVFSNLYIMHQNRLRHDQDRNCSSLLQTCSAMQQPFAHPCIGRDLSCRHPGDKGLMTRAWQVHIANDWETFDICAH